MSYTDRIISLTKQLYPKGRAFKMPVGGDFERLHNALKISEDLAYSNAVSILNDVLPDNENFDLDDASAWERRLGLITNTAVNIEDRKLAIKRKINFPGTITARQNFRYLQDQLQAAGFNVYVFENRFSDGMGGYYTQNPLEITGGSGGTSEQHGDFEHGGTEHGGAFQNIIANKIDERLDFNFSTGDNLRSTFFIGASILGNFASVDAQRKNEFRQLILKIKPGQTVGFLFINYI